MRRGLQPVVLVHDAVQEGVVVARRGGEVGGRGEGGRSWCGHSGQTLLGLWCGRELRESFLLFLFLNGLRGRRLELALQSFVWRAVLCKGVWAAAGPGERRPGCAAADIVVGQRSIGVIVIVVLAVVCLQSLIAEL